MTKAEIEKVEKDVVSAKHYWKSQNTERLSIEDVQMVANMRMICTALDCLLRRVSRLEEIANHHKDFDDWLREEKECIPH